MTNFPERAESWERGMGLRRTVGGKVSEVHKSQGTSPDRGPGQEAVWADESRPPRGQLSPTAGVALSLAQWKTTPIWSLCIFM